MENFAKICGPVCKIPRLTAAFRLWVTELCPVQKLQLLKAGVVLNYASNMQEKYQLLFLKNAICQVALCQLCRIAIAITRAHSVMQLSLIFFCDIIIA